MHSVSGLRVFDSAARLGSFKAAAAEIGVTPTAVSHQIRSLESQLGVALFTRKTRKVELTEAGLRLAVATTAAFQQINDALEELKAAEQTLTVTTTPAFAGLWLVPRIREFEEANPDLRVHVDTATSPVELSRERHIDVAIRYGSGDYPGVTSKVFIEEEFGAFGAPSYLAGLSQIEDADLIETQWRLGTVQPITWDDWFEVAGSTDPKVGKRRSFDEELHVVNAGLAGQGLILISRTLVSDIVKRGWLVPFRPEIALPGYTYAVATTETHAISRKVRRFLSWLEAVAQQ